MILQLIMKIPSLYSYLCFSPQDNKADLIINTYVDDIFVEVMKLLGKEIPEYKPEEDPVSIAKDEYIEWTISKKQLTEVKSEFKKKCDGGIKRRVLVNKEYKIQQDELKIQSRKLSIEILNKSLQEAKEPKAKKPKIEKVKKIPKQKVVKEIIVHESIELCTSDEDDLILVDDSKSPCTKVDTKETKEEKKVKLEPQSESVDMKEPVSKETLDSIKTEDFKISKVDSEVENIKCDIKEEIKDTKLNEDFDGKAEENVQSKEIDHDDFPVKESVEDQNGAGVVEKLKPNSNEQPNAESDIIDACKVKDASEKSKAQTDVEETVENVSKTIQDTANEKKHVQIQEDIEMREISKQINSANVTDEPQNGKII